jgi:hypothetical protein
MSVGLNGTTWDQNLICTNTIYCPHLSSNANGADFFQLGGGGYSFYGNTLVGYSMNYTGNQHQDGWQGLGDNYIKFAGNTFVNIENFAVFGDAYYGGFSHVWVYNNVFIGCVGPVFGTDGGYNGPSPCTFNDIVIANNVCDYGDTGNPIALNNVTSFATTFTACIVVNNTIINGSGIATQGNSTSTLIDNAVVSRTQATADFARYSTGTTNSDFHLLAAATSLIGHGANESGYFTTDKDGHARPATGNWDIGAYQYALITNATPLLQVTPGNISYGTILSGTSKTNSFTVANVGNGTLSGTASVGLPFSIISGGNYSLGASQSQTVTVVFSPGVASNYNQSVTFTGGGGTNATVSGSVTNASSVILPVLQVTPGNISYGMILSGTSKTNSFTVANVGNGTLSGTANVGAPFSVVSGGSYNLGASQSQTVTVVFSPSVTSNYNQSVTFTGGDGTNTTVTGSATNAPPVLPTVSAISVNATDVDLSLPGLQIYAGTTVQFSAKATNAQTWQWSYTVNGGATVDYTNSTSPITNISCYFDTNAISNSYVWTLVVSNGQAWAESQTNLEVEALPNPGGTGTTNTGLAFVATSGALSGILTANTIINGVPRSYVYQPLPSIGDISGGAAVYNFTITNAGNYEVQALVNAPSLNANSFYVNIDGQPQDATMIWDIMPITSGFEQRIVSWRGNGSENNDLISPKVFQLSTGSHQITFVGREPGTALASFSLVQVVPAAPTAAPALTLRSIQSNPVQPPATPDGLRIVSP